MRNTKGRRKFVKLLEKIGELRDERREYGELEEKIRVLIRGFRGWVGLFKLKTGQARSV